MDVENTVRQLTLEEKAAFCSGYYYWHTKGLERLGIPKVMMCDGPHGLRKQVGAEDHLGLNESVLAVCFPSASALAASFDRNVMEELGTCLGKECQAEHVGMLLGPGVNMKRSPLCGRNFEYFSEDPYLAGELAASYVKSLQKEGVAACVKHFACNNQETDRMSGDSRVDERTLREIYLPAFEAGLDLEMPGGPGAQDQKIVDVVREGRLDETVLDRTVERILRFVSDCVEQEKETVWNHEDAHRKAVEIAGECMVLLENRDQILPLKKDVKTAFIGEFAVKPRYQGGGSSHVNPWKVTGTLDTALEKGANVVFARGYDTENEEDQKQVTALIEEAVQVAREAEAAVIFAGLPDAYESEGKDRTSLEMPEVQNRLIGAVAEVQPNTVVVLHAGAPVLLPWRDRVKGILLAYLCGEGAGEAEEAILYGRVNPSGKLAETFPLKLEHNPSYLNFPGENGTVEYREGVFTGYRYYDKKALDVAYPFGFGLSYTEFDYDDLRLEKENIKDTETLRVTCRVKNTGTLPGKEALQLYVEPREGTSPRPVRELKGFEKISLMPGESRKVSFVLDGRAFAYYSTEISDWYVPSGDYRVQIGASSRDLRLEKTVHVEGTKNLPVHYCASMTVGQLIREEKGRQFVMKILAKYMHLTELEIEEQPDIEDCPEIIENTIKNTMMGMPLASMVTYGALKEEQLEAFLEKMNS